MHFTREAELLRCCARTKMEPERAARLRALVAGPLDWTRVFELASLHGLVPLVATHLAPLADGVPAQWGEQFRVEQRSVLFRNLNLAGALVQILRFFHSVGIPALTYKGPALAEQLYGNLGLRTFSDVDVLLAHADLPRARDILLREGFSTDADAFSASRAGIAGQFLFHDARRGLLLELHSERTLRHFPRPLPADWLCGSPQTVVVAGKEISTLNPTKQLIALAVHGTKDLWEQWKWVCDIGEFLRVHGALDWAAAFDEARRLGCHRIVLLSLALARDLLDARVPAAVAAELRADASAAPLAAWLLRRMGGQAAGLSAAERFFLRINVCDALTDGVRHALRLTTTPADDDWQAARLPALLYPVVRPFRLLRKYGQR